MRPWETGSGVDYDGMDVNDFSASSVLGGHFLSGYIISFLLGFDGERRDAMLLQKMC